MKTKSLVLFFGLMAGGCEALAPAPGARPEVRVRIQSTMFEIDANLGTAHIPLIVQNAGAQTVYLARCGDAFPAVLERRQSGQWMEASAVVCQAVYDMSPLPLSVGEARAGTYSVAVPGTYRLRLGVSGSTHGQYRWTVVSEPFVVE